MERGRIAEGIDVFYLNLGETRFLYEEIFENHGYVKHGISLDDRSVVFDVGANIGLVGVYLHLRWPGIRLYCFEPIPETFAVLEANVKLHGLQARLFRCALGREPGDVTFTFYPNNSVMSGRYADRVEDAHTTRAFIGNKNPAVLERAKESPDLQQHVDSMLSRLFESRPVTCPVRRLSEVIAIEKVERIDLLKIDVEKAEHEVIAGIDDQDWAKIRQVVVEIHNLDGRLEQCTDLLERQGFNLAVEQDPMLATANIYNLYGRR